MTTEERQERIIAELERSHEKQIRAEAQQYSLADVTVIDEALKLIRVLPSMSERETRDTVEHHLGPINALTWEKIARKAGFP